MVSRLVLLIAPLVVGGCELIAGLDEDRPHAVRDDALCLSGAHRCSLGGVESCVDGAWTPQETCALGCSGGACSTALVAAGSHHTCARVAGGQVVCWGRNDFMQLGSDGGQACRKGTWCRPTPQVVDGLSGVTALASLGHHSCAIAEGQVQCWGHDAFGQLGDLRPNVGEGQPPSVALIPFAGEVPVIVRAGAGEYATYFAGHSCAVTNAGRVYCWGANCAGQIGLGVGDRGTCPVLFPVCEEGDVVTNVPAPSPVTLPFHVIDIVVGAAHTCALSDLGEVYCWGWNSFGQVDPRDVSERCVIAPRRVDGLVGIVQLTAGSRVTCATREDGQVLCWGVSENGVLGVGTVDTGPIAVPGIGPSVEVVAGHGTHACAREADGTLWCWGENENGELGLIENATAKPEDKDVEPATSEALIVPTIPPVTAVALGGNHTCAWGDDGELYCWGQAAYGAVGNEPDDHPKAPHAVDLSPP